MTLTQQQVNFFRATGYLKLSETLPLDLLGAVSRQISLEVAEERPPLFRNTDGRVIKLAALFERGGIYEELAKSRYLLDPLQKLLGPNIEFTLNRHNHATLNLKGKQTVRLHRDVLQWSRTIITVIVYLEESTIANGCTYLIPGSHYLPFVGTPNNGGTWMDEHSVYADLIEQAVPVPMPKGGILFFDGLVFHTVGANTTDESRTSIALGYHSVDELANSNQSRKVLVGGQQLYRGNEVK